MKPTFQTSQTWNRKYLPIGGAEKVYLLIELTGNAGVRVERAPMNVSMVLDRSGSMEGSPLQFSKKACKFVVDQMGAKDRLSMVSFDNEVDTIIKPQGITHKDLLKKQIDKIQSGGSTNLSGGLLQGIQHVLQDKKEGSVNRVILLSDGHANSGITNPDKLKSIANEFRSAGIGITAMGVGDGFDEELMEGIADHGGGNFYYIKKPDDIPSIFAKELEGLCSVVAQNVQLILRVEENVQITNIFGYHAASHAEGESTIALGDLFDQEVKSILLEFAFFVHEVGEHPVMNLKWDYVDVSEGALLCSLEQEIQAIFTNDIHLLLEPTNAKVDKQVQITQSAIVIEEAIQAFDQGDEAKGKMMLQEQADQMLVMAIQSEDEGLRMESQILYDQLENFTYSSETRKSLHENKYRQMKRKKL